jgi:hypothetical protein
VAAPDTLAELRWEAVLVGWLSNAGVPINNFLSAAGIPIRVPTDRVLFGVHRFVAPDPEGETADTDDGDDGGGDGDQTIPPGSDPGTPLYVLRLRVETENANQARALAALLAFIRVFMESQDIQADVEYLETLRPLLANPPSQDGADLAIQTEPMGAREIALLFNRFAVYSQQIP